MIIDAKSDGSHSLSRTKRVSRGKQLSFAPENRINAFSLENLLTVTKTNQSSEVNLLAGTVGSPPGRLLLSDQTVSRRSVDISQCRRQAKAVYTPTLMG